MGVVLLVVSVLVVVLEDVVVVWSWSGHWARRVMMVLSKRAEREVLSSISGFGSVFVPG
jgi:hypothetical protein